MSLLLIEVLPDGIIFGADPNISIPSMGTAESEYEQRCKLLRWPNNRALIGYVGLARIRDQWTDDWLHDFKIKNLTFTSLEGLSKSLQVEIEQQGIPDKQPLVFMIGGFEERGGRVAPALYEIGNYKYKGDPFNIYEEIRKTFVVNPYPFEKHCKPEDLKSYIAQLASDYNPLWVHQGFDLGTFNTLEHYLKAAFRALCQSHPDHYVPTSLLDWERQVRMSVLAYIAYFQAHKGPSEQYVGGGVDTEYIPWPDSEVF